MQGLFGPLYGDRVPYANQKLGFSKPLTGRCRFATKNDGDSYVTFDEKELADWGFDRQVKFGYGIIPGRGQKVVIPLVPFEWYRQQHHEIPHIAVLQRPKGKRPLIDLQGLGKVESMKIGDTTMQLLPNGVIHLTPPKGFKSRSGPWKRIEPPKSDVIEHTAPTIIVPNNWNAKRILSLRSELVKSQLIRNEFIDDVVELITSLTTPNA